MDTQHWFNFITCQRDNGTFYGNGGATCKKGVKSSLEEVEKRRQSGTLSTSVSDFVTKHAVTITEAYQLDVLKVATAKAEWERRTEEVLQRLKNDQLTIGEVEGVVVRGLQHDVSKSEFVLIGMEESGVPGTFDKRLAGKIAAQQMIADGHDPDFVVPLNPIHEGAEFITSGKGITGYITNATRIANTISGREEITTAEATSMFFAGKKVGTIEMMGLDSRATGEKETADPNLSMYGVLRQSKNAEIAKFGDRKFIESNYAEKRADFVLNQLKTAAENPDFKGALAMPGGGAKWSSFKENLVDKMVKAGIPVYETPQTLKLQNGKTLSKEMLVAEIAPGKYMVAGAFFPGYGLTEKNVPFAYNAALESVRAGVANKYKPSEKKKKTSKTKSPTETRPTKITTTKQDPRERQKAALRIQAEKLRDQGKSINQIRETLRVLYGSLVEEL